MSEEGERTGHRREHSRLDLDALQVSIRALRLSMVNITSDKGRPRPLLGKTSWCDESHSRRQSHSLRGKWLYLPHTVWGDGPAGASVHIVTQVKN